MISRLSCPPTIINTMAYEHAVLGEAVVTAAVLLLLLLLLLLSGCDLQIRAIPR